MNQELDRPIAEIVAIGDELTSGQRLDTNSQWLSQQLAGRGIPVHYHSTVGDDASAMLDVIRTSIRRANIVVMTGGLGPTADDLTREVIASAAGVDLELHQPSLARLEQRYAARKRPMPENNRQQAMFPVGATVIPNLLGTAPGIEMAFASDQCHLYALPGVPAEMKPMFETEVMPSIIRTYPETGVILHRSLQCFGAGESDVEMLLPDLIRRGRQPAVGITASAGTITLRIAAAGDDHEHCRRLIEPVELLIRDTLGDLVFGDSGQTLQDVLVDQLRTRCQTMAVVDGGVGGMLGSWLHAADPDGDVFRGGLSNAARSGHDVDDQLSQAHQMFGADYVLLVGPDSLPGQDPQRTIAVLHQQRIWRDSIIPIRNSTIGVPHSAKQALNYLRKLLNRQFAGGSGGRD